MTLVREAGFNPDSREWFVGCPECTERVPVGLEGMTGTLYGTCITCDVAMQTTINIARMG